MSQDVAELRAGTFVSAGEACARSPVLRAAQHASGIIPRQPARMPLAAAMKFWSIVFFIGASQAALLALALWRRTVNSGANRALAVWIALIGFDLLIKALYFQAPSAGLYKLYRFVGLFAYFYSAFFYVYVGTLVEGRGLRWRDAVHLAPFLFALAVTLPLFLLGTEAMNALFARIRGGEGVAGRWWMDVLLFSCAVGYIGAALWRLQRYRRGLLQRRSDADRLSLHWITAMAVSQVVIWAIAIVQWLGDIPWIDYPLIYGAVAAWVFLVGYLSLHQAAVAVEPAATPEPDSTATPEADDARFPAVETRLAQLMRDDRLYAEPALTIAQLARRSGYPEYLVSAVINRRLGGNFWEYINTLRIEAVRERLADGADARTILDIAYASGYTSKSTFNAAFKRAHGETPSTYRQRCGLGRAGG
jgi:AraC-like DNA-binding protein